MRICIGCKKSEKEMDFYKQKSVKYCKECFKQYMREKHKNGYNVKTNERTRNRRLKHITAVTKIKKQIGKCACCPETEVACFVLHHLDPTQKDFGIGENIVRSWKLIINEIEKCVVVCCNCHAKIHAGLIDTSNMQTINLALVTEVADGTDS